MRLRLALAIAAEGVDFELGAPRLPELICIRPAGPRVIDGPAAHHVKAEQYPVSRWLTD